MVAHATQRDRLREILAVRPIVRASELRHEGIAAQIISRALEDGEIERIGRGLYQRPDNPIDAGHALAETAKKIPRGVIAMTSALAFHGLTDQMPRRIWVAIGKTDWEPAPSYPPTRIVRFDEKYLRQGVEHHTISGVSVFPRNSPNDRCFSSLTPRSFTNCFRWPTTRNDRGMWLNDS